MIQLTQQEEDVFSCFHVTGFFGKKPKPNVGRKYDMVWRLLNTNRPDPKRTMEDIRQGLDGLADKGLLELNSDKGQATLTDRGYQEISSRS